ncbi:hypothetical protein [Streptomyces sp. AK010]|uniref:hypothetical protein n=1 Tax=Streptomyces sp. AK010 TaxID=2723074 RepID=UPI0016177FB3|nr:hypothetical protein [Streptomyces sp. AK010]MBB6421509.1 hypothetical protein [Streptomyces sp. AK010]
MTTDTTPSPAPASAASQQTPAPVGVELRYALSAEPFPLSASESFGAYRKTDLTIVLTRRAAVALECGPITVSVPVGSGSGALAAETAGMSAFTDPPGWDTTIAASGLVTFTPPGGTARIGKENGVALSVHKVPVNRTVGRAALTVNVPWRLSGESDWGTETIELPVTKFPPSFSLGELYASPGRIAHNGSVTLTWQASGGSFRLIYGKADVSVTGRGTYTAHNITSDTLFQLRGTSSSASGELEAVRSAWVTVDIPDIVTQSLTATRGITTDRLAGLAGNSVPVFQERTMEHQPELSMRTYDPLRRTSTAPVRLPFFGRAASAPALAVHGGKLHMLFCPYGGEQLTWATYDGGTWQRMPNPPGPAAAAPVALTTFGTSLVCAYGTPDGQRVMRISADGTTWGAASPMPALDGGGVSLCSRGPELFATMRPTEYSGISTFYRYEAARQEWRSLNNIFVANGSLELAMRGETLAIFYRNTIGRVWVSRRRANPQDDDTDTLHVRASDDVRAVSYGPRALAVFPNSDGMLQAMSSDGTEPPEAPTVWSTPVQVDEYPVTETPALAWYRDRIVAIGRSGAAVPEG